MQMCTFQFTHCTIKPNLKQLMFINGPICMFITLSLNTWDMVSTVYSSVLYQHEFISSRVSLKPPMPGFQICMGKLHCSYKKKLNTIMINILDKNKATLLSLLACSASLPQQWPGAGQRGQQSLGFCAALHVTEGHWMGKGSVSVTASTSISSSLWESPGCHLLLVLTMCTAEHCPNFQSRNILFSY